MSNLCDQIDDLSQRTAVELEKVKSQSTAIEESHSLLREFIFQTTSNVKAADDDKQKLEILGNTLREINKYTDQEIQKYMCNLASLSGRIQGLQQALMLIKAQEDNDLKEVEPE